MKRTPVWPAYLVAAACLAIALISSIADIALLGQLKQAQADLSGLSRRSAALSRNLADERTTLSDMLDSAARHHAVDDGDVITHGSRIYVAMHDLPEPPHGKVYQAWTLAKGAKKMTPSVTFVPGPHGVALVVLPANARTTAEMTLTIEPDGGSKQPTSKPLVDVAFGSE